MDLRLSLKRLLVCAMLGVFVVGAMTFGITTVIGNENTRYVTTTIIAVVAVILAGVSLFVAIYQIEVHMRPFVTVAKIQQVTSNGPSGEAATIPYELNACYIELQNTGPVPAEEVETHISMLQRTTKEVAVEVFMVLPLLPPNGQETIEFPNIPREMQVKVCAGQTMIEVTLNYKGLGKKHSTKQSFFIERAEVRQVAGARGIFVFKHTNPSYLR